MQADIKFMLRIYKTYDLDWMGDEIKDVKYLTKHHIQKREKNGANEIYNYALLTPRSHQLLHYLEDNNYGAYCALNDLFRELNFSIAPPTAEYYEKVKKILRVVKKQIKNRDRKRRKTRSR